MQVHLIWTEPWHADWTGDRGCAVQFMKPAGVGSAEGGIYTLRRFLALAFVLVSVGVGLIVTIEV